MRRPLESLRPFGPVVKEGIEGKYIIDIEPLNNQDNRLPVQFRNKIASRKDVTVPSNIRNMLNLEQGDEVIFEVSQPGSDKSVEMDKNLTARNTLGLSTKGNDGAMEILDLTEGTLIDVTITEVRQ